MYGEEGVAQRKAAAAASRRKYDETGKVDFVPAYSEVDQSRVNYGPAGSYDYYLNRARGNVPEYRNESAVRGAPGQSLQAGRFDESADELPAEQVSIRVGVDIPEFEGPVAHLSEHASFIRGIHVA